MDHIWNKLDGYTKSDHLESSDEGEASTEVTRQTTYPSTSSENSLPEDVERESSSEDVDVEQDGCLHNNLLNKFKTSQLHCDTESRNIQEKIDDLSAEKKRQPKELTEMHQKAQVISRSARMSPEDVLSSIANSETLNSEENSQMKEYYKKIRSVNTESHSTEVSSGRNHERTSSSSDIDLPNIPSSSGTVLNTGVMKSKANIARQGSMKARRKPTTMKRKSWTPGMNELDLREEEEMEEDTQDAGGSNTWVLSQSNADAESNHEPLHRSGSFTPSDSSSDEEKEDIKPHLRSGIALPGLGDALKIQQHRSELKRPTALSLVKSAKDAMENEVTREDKTEVTPPKPDWMKEVEERRKTTRPPRRKHVTMPARCSELDKLFEQRKNLPPPEALVMEADRTNQEEGAIAKENSRAKNFPDQNIDPELSKLLERRRNLKPMEGVTTDGTQADTLRSVRPRSLHLDKESSELDKIFERRRNLRPVEGVRTDTEQSTSDAPLTAARRSLPAVDRQTSGIVRARFHEGNPKLEPLPTTVKVATINHVKTKATIEQVPSASETTAAPGSSSRDGAQVCQVAQFVFDGKGATRATLGRIPPTGIQRPASDRPEPTLMSPSQVPQLATRSNIQSRDDQGATKAEPNQGINNYESSMTVGLFETSNHIRLSTQHRVPSDDHTNNRNPVPQARVSPRGNTASGGCLVSEPRSKQEGTVSDSHFPALSPKSSTSDTRSFIEQLSVRSVSGSNRDKSIGVSGATYRVHSRDTSVERVSCDSGTNVEPETPVCVKSVRYTDSNRGHLARQLYPADPQTLLCEPNSSISQFNNYSPRSPDPKSQKTISVGVRSQNSRTQDLKTEKLRSGETGTQKLRSQDLRPRDTTSQERRIIELREQESRAAELRFQEFSPQELRSSELKSQDIRFHDLGSRDMVTQEFMSQKPQIQKLTSRDQGVVKQTPRGASQSSLPPLIVKRNYQSSNVKSPPVKSPEKCFFGQRDEDSLYGEPCEVKYDTISHPGMVRKEDQILAISPHSHDNRNMLTTVGNKQLSDQVVENGPSLVKSCVKTFPSGGRDIDLGSQGAEPAKPVTVTVKSISEAAVRVRLGDNEQSPVRGDMLPRLVNGEVLKQNGEVNGWSEGCLKPQSSEPPSLVPIIPKWKQELKEKKRLQKERQSEMIDMSRQKDNIKAAASGNDLAEWQKRLQGIKKTWSENEVKDKNDNIKGDDKSDQQDEDGKDIPDFLKEFQAKKGKQKVKVTVTAKSTTNHQEAQRANLGEDKESSRKQEKGTYV